VILNLIIFDRIFVSNAISAIDVDNTIWILRKLSMIISLGILFYYAQKYQDYHEINYQLIQEINSKLPEHNKSVVN